jgi:RNA polymerase sigma-70 factor (ECF subfamily)
VVVQDVDGTNRALDAGQEGETELIAALYRQHRSSLVWHIRCLGATETEAHDAVQDAFAAALRIGRIRDQNAWYAWLRTVAVRSYRHSASRKGDPVHIWYVTVDSALTADIADSLALRVPDLAEARLQEQIVLDLLRALPKRQRLVFCLHYEGWTTPEIATELGMKEAAVRKGISRARRSLQDLIAQGGEDDC